MTDLLDQPTVHRLPVLEDSARATLFTDARTANSFSSAPVTDEQLASVWELAKWAPSAANSQPLRVLYVRTEEGRQRLVARMNEGNKAKTASAPVVAVLALDTRYHDHMPTLFPFMEGMREALEADPGMHAATSGLSAGMQAGYFLLAVRAHGLAAGPMAGFDKAGLDAEFFPEGGWTSLLVVNIGHPGENPWFDRLPRLPHEDVVRYV